MGVLFANLLARLPGRGKERTAVWEAVEPGEPLGGGCGALEVVRALQVLHEPCLKRRRASARTQCPCLKVARGAVAGESGLRASGAREQPWVRVPRKPLPVQQERAPEAHARSEGL